jgi:hypothetical protein
MKYISIAVAGAALTFIGPAQAASSLSGENARDIDRVTLTTVQQANRLRSTVTPQAVAQLMPRLSAAPSDPLDTIMAWHLISLNVTAVDHTAANGTNAYHEQYGPHRTSRALAIVHTAMFEVANAFAPSGSKYKSYVNQVKGSNVIAAPPAGASEAAAIIEAAYGTLTSLYPGQLTNLKSVHDSAIAALGSSASTSAGQAFGVSVSQAVNDLRANDNSNLPEPRWDSGPAPSGFVPKQPTGTPGQWAIDPVSNIATALGGNWPQVTPWTLTSPSQFRSKLPGPRDLSSQEYRDAFNEVEKSGGDPKLNTPRPGSTTDEYFQAKFWSYDATAGLCAPVRLYDQIADEVLEEYSPQIAPHLNTDHIAAASEVGRYYALINIAMADAAIVAWDAKYFWQFWRPVTGIRAAQEASDPGGNRIELWYPLGAQQTNSISVINITPPFPAYPSGHATFGGALFQVLRDFVPNDKGFSFQSDEFNGAGRPKAPDGSQQPNIDVYNFIRCVDGDTNDPQFCKPTLFTSFKDAEMKNNLSRVWMGVHWRFDATDGSTVGEYVGNNAFNNYLRPAQ